MANSRPNEKYVIHSEILKLYESLGLKITKIHRGIRFNQKWWLAEYIDLNIKLRTAAKNSFERRLFQVDEQLCFWKDDGEYWEQSGH